MAKAQGERPVGGGIAEERRDGPARVYFISRKHR
jgi:hypothetical protein